MQVIPRLGDSYATKLAELVVPWQASTFSRPHPIIVNEPLARELGLAPEGFDAPWFLLGVDASREPRPVAMAYAGHQFGVYVPRLGDGRALLLGELEHHGQVVDVHLKGSGPTPFARGGDGFAAVGPMLREYVVSEAMHALGIPTSRSLAVLGTGDTIHRETPQPGAVLARVAASHIRVGTFQFASRDPELLRRLADYAIARHYPHLRGDYLGFYRAVIAAQARLVAQWLGVGFVHGVMNTDNTTISGESIDYGPCAFLDAYDPNAVFSSIDHQGRYAYGNQPGIVQWNLARFGEALLPLFGDPAPAQVGLDEFPRLFNEAWNAVLARKLGLAPAPDVRALAQDLLALAGQTRADFTMLFRSLTDHGTLTGPSPDLPEPTPETAAWEERWRERGPDPALMRRANPLYIPRNHVLDDALSAASHGDMALLETLLTLVTDPFTPRPDTGDYLRGGPPGFRTFCGT